MLRIIIEQDAGMQASSQMQMSTGTGNMQISPQTQMMGSMGSMQAMDGGQAPQSARRRPGASSMPARSFQKGSSIRDAGAAPKALQAIQRNPSVGSREPGKANGGGPRNVLI